MWKQSFCKSPSQLTEELQHWFGQSPGAELQAQELALLERLLSERFGYYLLQIGCMGFQEQPLQASRIRFQCVLAPNNGVSGVGNWVQGDPMNLPFASDSIDVVLLTHTLDFSTDPHQLLREVERVLIPEGHVLLLGFNPWSLWGLWRLFRKRRGQAPWCGDFISPARVSDWLSLLGFDIKASEHLMFRPPLAHAGMMKRLGFMERFGQRYWRIASGGYLIHGVKRVSTLTPVQPAWKLRARVLGGRRAVEPSTRNINQG